MAMIKGSLCDAIKDTIGKTTAGESALESEDDPLTLINILYSTDFSGEASMVTDPVEKFFNAMNRFTDDRNFCMGVNESLDVWVRRFNACIAKIELLARVARLDLKLPTEKMKALAFYNKLGVRYKGMRERYDFGLVDTKPATVDEMVDVARFYNNHSRAMSHIISDKPQQKGAYHSRVETKPDEKCGVSTGGMRCNTHNTNSHKYDDDECKRLRATNGHDSRKAHAGRGSGGTGGGRGSAKRV